ncbi:LOW QUALITY PROTEIN: hypothetical protein U9M48_039261, partial [Paspalum notatum var. saurae]
MSMEDDAMDYDYYAAAEADDEERELEAQNEAEDARRFVLGSSAAAAIDVDGAGAGARTGTGMRTGSTSPTGTATASTSGNRSRRRGPTSKVCLDFEEITEIHAGKEVRVSAICLHCKNTLSAKSSSGTGHLRRHLDLCPSKKEKHRHGRTQSLLKFNADGSVVHWEYSPSVARTELCQYIIDAHNPKFVKPSRQTTARDLIGLYNDRVEHLVYALKNFVSSVALTYDIWSGKAKEDYISVVAHFVNSDWCLEKRLLDLKPIEVAHTGANIAERVEMVASDYGITDKIFVIVLDNASSNKTAMDVLKPVFSGYIGSLMPKPARNEDDLAAVFLHRCRACHIINLIVNSCLKRLLPYLEDFRTAITLLNSSNQCIASYKQYCLSVGVRPRKFGVDMDVRWNSTSLMLKHLVPYQSTFFAATEKLLSFLQFFYDSTVALSGVYYPTSPLMPHHILKIGRHLNAYESYELLRPAIVPMKTKFLKYWREIPILCAFAFILDPRAKMGEFNKVLQNRYPTSMRTKLTKIFQVYERKFGDACLSNPILPGGASGNGACAGAGAGTSSSSDLSELSSYLDSDTEVMFGPDFNILNWWQRHNQTYPILSILAKNVLTVPVSTVSSKSTFSLASRVLEERRQRLTLDMVETGSWLTHKQHTVEKESKELEAAFEAMYLDDEGTSPDSKRKEQESGNAANVQGRRTKDQQMIHDQHKEGEGMRHIQRVQE